MNKSLWPKGERNNFRQLTSIRPSTILTKKLARVHLLLRIVTLKVMEHILANV